MEKELIDKVEKINPEAAEYLRTEVPKLPSFNAGRKDLITLFLWNDSPQGREYWNNIWKQLP